MSAEGQGGGRTRVWSSPLDAAALVAGAANPGEVRVAGATVVWSENRPSEGGRIALVTRDPDGAVRDVLPAGTSARSRVHEYGGGAWAVGDGVVVYGDDTRDGQVFRVELASDGSGGPAVALSPSAAHATGDRSVRYADLQIDPVTRRVFAVRERHDPDGVRNDLVAFGLSGDAADDPDRVEVCASGADFYASPALDATGRWLAYVRWNLPDMPWDATEVVVVDLATGIEQVVAGGPDESVVEPSWAPDGSLTVLSDRSGWWNPYRWDPSTGVLTPLARVEAEIGGALWVFGNRSLAWLDTSRYVAVRTAGGTDTLVLGDRDGRALIPLDVPFSHIPQVVTAGDGTVVVVAGTPTAESSVYRVTLDPSGDGRVTVEPLRAPRPLPFPGDPTRWISTPTPVEVPVGDGAVTHALVYPPCNPDAVVDGLPPLLVKIHGGPTSAARAQFDLGVQFWTTRGFCVADVNYRGSTGYGRAYQRALEGAWGIADVEDCVAVARHLADTGVVDPDRLGIRGGSAGGFTTLAALVFHDTFTAGASSYGIADLAVLAQDTHKFESRYLDTLVGPWPEAEATYRERSPLFHLDGLSCPVAILQGDLDAVVPPNQADAIVEVLRAKGLAHAVVHFPDEGHGFRNAPNIVRALEGELWFFARAFGLSLDESITPLDGAGLAEPT